MPHPSPSARWLLPLLMLVATAAAAMPPPSAPAACAAPVATLSGNDLERIARSLAGLPGGYDGAPLAAHAAALDASFERLERVQLQRIRAWSAQALPPAVHAAPALFYPFSGPDVLYATALFPQAQRMLFTGLETVGEPPQAAHFESPALADSLGELRRSLATLLGRSFFVTAQMQSQFPRNQFRGVTPVLLLLLARAGYVPESVAPLVLADDGRLCARGFDQRVDLAGVEIRYRAPGERTARSLVYLRVDLSDEGLARAPGYPALVREFGVQASYLKSASYLMHTREFAAIRALLLEVSPALLQDDSGIPFRHFDADSWQATLFGAYRRGGGGFEHRVQDDLKAAFAAAPASPLPFWIGYRHSAADSNLQLYRRRE